MENITYQNIISLLKEDSEGALNGELLVNNKPYYVRKPWSNRNIAIWEKGPSNPPLGDIIFDEHDAYVVIGEDRTTIFTAEPIK